MAACDEDVLGGAELDYLTVAHDRDAVAEAHGLVEVVGDEDDRLLQPLLQFEQLVLHVAADQRVERAEGLVHQQQVRVGGERAGQAHTLLHTAGQLVGPGVLQPHETRHLQGLGRALVALRAGHSLDLQAVARVLQDTAVGEEREVLEDHADLLRAHFAQRAVAEGGQVLAVEEHPARRRLKESVEHAQERGLAGSRETHDHEDVARLDGEGCVDDRSSRPLTAQLIAAGAVLEFLHGFIGSSAEHFVQAVGLQPGHIHLTR